MLKEIYNYRELLKTSVKKEIRGKYKGSFLGILWSFVSPLLMTFVYALVFSYLMRGAEYEHYTTFLIIGILPWTWFTTSIAQGTYTILGNAGIIKKVYFPREILPISVVTSGLVNFLISCIIIALFLIFTGMGFSIYLIYFPFIILTQYILTLGVILITSAINVYVRDLEYIINFLIQLLFYGTPILYSIELFKNAPKVIYWLIKYNPMSVIISSYRDILYWKKMEYLVPLGVVFLVSIALLVIGICIFKKLSKGFAEEV